MTDGHFLTYFVSPWDESDNGRKIWAFLVIPSCRTCSQHASEAAHANSAWCQDWHGVISHMDLQPATCALHAIVASGLLLTEGNSIFWLSLCTCVLCLCPSN